MRKDYHMHPQVLRYPERFALYAERALQKNITEICVTDHMPLSVSSASDRIPHGAVKQYCNAVRELAKVYEGRIRIKCGIEIDYHKSVLPEIEAVLGEGEFDFVLASSHMHVFLKDYAAYTRNDFAAAALENAVQAAETGWFHALSHPDMYRFAFENATRFPFIPDTYSPQQHKALICELLDRVAAQKMYLEINPHLAESKGDLFYTYPEAPIVAWAKERGVHFSYGSDAHKPESVGALLEELEAHPVYGEALQAWECAPPK